MAEKLYTQCDLIDLMAQIEREVHKHGKFVAEPDSTDFRMSRLGCTFAIRVKLKSSRKKPGEIHGSGDNPWAAAENLISGLDHWAGAWK